MKLNYFKTLVLGFGFLGVSALLSIYGAFVPVFLSQKFHLAPFYLSCFVTLDNLAGLLVQPPAGVWSDKIRTPIGRRMPFILVGASAAVIAFVFIPVAPILPLFILCTSTLLISMALWRTPIMALVADVTPSPLRSQASGLISLMGGIGAIMAYFGGGALYKINPAYPFWLGAVIIIVAVITVFVCIKEPQGFETASVGLDESQPGFMASLKGVIQDPDKSTLNLLLALFFLMVSYSAIETYFPLYALHHLALGPADSARLLGQVAVAFVLFAWPSGILGGRIGRKATTMTGIAAMGTLLLVLHFLPIPFLLRVLCKLPILGDVSIVGVVLMLLGIAWALIIIHPLPMLSDMADNRSIGTYTGVYYLFTSAAAIVGPLLYGWVVQLSGKDYNAVMLFSPISLAIAWALMWGVKKGDTVIPDESMAIQLGTGDIVDAPHPIEKIATAPYETNPS